MSQLLEQAAAGRRLACEPIPDFLLDMVRYGGLLPTLRQRLTREKLKVK
jgi:3-isopropylmalate/(R)-2-methylmalate dehydratase small subunit